MSSTTLARRALLLSTIHEPIAFISYRRMISLIRREVVEVVADWHDDNLMPGVATPAILRLKNFILSNTSHKMCSYNRGVVLARDNFRCQYCQKLLSYRESTIDHVMPRSRGGKNHWTNCVASCKNCNRSKRNMTPTEAKMPLLGKPGIPSVAHFWMANVRRTPSENEWHEAWTNFV